MATSDTTPLNFGASGRKKRVTYASIATSSLLVKTGAMLTAGTALAGPAEEQTPDYGALAAYTGELEGATRMSQQELQETQGEGLAWLAFGTAAAVFAGSQAIATYNISQGYYSSFSNLRTPTDLDYSYGAADGFDGFDG
jgi:hypothetical protein